MTTINKVAEVFADALEKRANGYELESTGALACTSVAAALRDVAAAQGEDPRKEYKPEPCVGDGYPGIAYALEEARTQLRYYIANRDAALATIDTQSQQIELLTDERDAARAEADRLRAELAAFLAEPTEEQCEDALAAKGLYFRVAPWHEQYVQEARAWLAAWRKVLGGEKEAVK